MNRYFDLRELKRDMNRSRVFKNRLENAHLFKIRNIKDLCGNLPADGEQFFLETTKSFNAFTFIVYIIKHSGRIDKLSIATYSINDRIINSLMKWKEAESIDEIEIKITASIQFRMPDVYRRLESLSNEGKITVVYAWSHKKVTCIQSKDGFFVVEGSGNYGENAQEEQYIFLNNKEIYEFRRQSIAK